MKNNLEPLIEAHNEATTEKLYNYNRIAILLKHSEKAREVLTQEYDRIMEENDLNHLDEELSELFEQEDGEFRFAYAITEIIYSLDWDNKILAGNLKPWMYHLRG